MSYETASLQELMYRIANASATRGIAPIPGVVPNTATAYAAAGLVIGNAVAVQTGQAQGTLLDSVLLRFRVRNAVQTAGAPNSLIAFFNDNPNGGSVIADNTNFNMADADMGKLSLVVAAAWASSGPAATGVQTCTVTGPRMVVGANGFIYFVLIAGGAHTLNAVNSIYYTVEAKV